MQTNEDFNIKNIILNIVLFIGERKMRKQIMFININNSFCEQAYIFASFSSSFLTNKHFDIHKHQQSLRHSSFY